MNQTEQTRDLLGELLALDAEPLKPGGNHWAQEIRYVKGAGGFGDSRMFVGDLVPSGNVRIVPFARVFLIAKEAAIQRRPAGYPAHDDSIMLYRLAIMYPSGNLALTAIQADSDDPQWAKHLRLPVRRLLESHVYEGMEGGSIRVEDTPLDLPALQEAAAENGYCDPQQVRLLLKAADEMGAIYAGIHGFLSAKGIPITSEMLANREEAPLADWLAWRAERRQERARLQPRPGDTA